MGLYYIGSIPCSGGDIYHYGRKGMKWGKNIFGDLADRLSGAAKNAVSKVSDWSGYSARSNRDYYSNLAKNTKGWWNSGARGAAENKASAYNAQYKNSPMGRIEGAANTVREQAQQAMAKAREQVSKAYADAAEKAGSAGKNIQAFYADVMSKAKATISKGKNLVSKYGGQFVSQVQELGGKALEGGKNFLEGIMKKVKQVKSKATEPISRLKARKAEKRDAEYDVGHKSNHDRNLGRERSYDKHNRGSGLGPYTPHRDNIIEYYNDYTGDQKSRPGHDDNGNLIGGYKRSKGKPGNKVLEERVRDQYRTERQAYKAVDKKTKKK